MEISNKQDATNYATEHGGTVVKVSDGVFKVVSTPTDRYNEEALGLQGEALALSGEIAQGQLELSSEQIEIAKRQQQMAEEQYTYWKRNFAPVERDVTQQA